MTVPHTELDRVALELADHKVGTQIFDRQARKYFNVSGAEFARASCAAEIDTGNSNGLKVSMLLPLAGIWCDDWTKSD